MKFLKSSIVLILLFMMAGPQIHAQVLAADWKVPDQVKGRISPFKFTKETVTMGEGLFQRNCKACHGDPGHHNFAAIVPTPGDPASEEFQKQTDGDMFFRITTGKTPMPSFKAALSGEERWDVISYLRSFNPSYVQPSPALQPAIVERNIKLNMYCDYKRKKIYTCCSEITKDNKTVPVDNAEIQLLVGRYFGNMPAAASIITNHNGEATFDFPQNIPGNRYGIIHLISRVNDETGLLGDAQAGIDAGIGLRIHPVSLTAQRAMWNIRSKSPVWLMLSYVIGVVVVWGLILYIAVSIAKIRNL